MITVTIQKRYGAATLRARISAPTVERAVEISGPGARVEFPIDGETFFAETTAEGIDYAAMTHEEVEKAYKAGLPGSYEPHLNRFLAASAFHDLIAAALGGEGDEEELERRYLRLSGKAELSEAEQRELAEARHKGEYPFDVCIF